MSAELSKLETLKKIIIPRINGFFSTWESEKKTLKSGIASYDNYSETNLKDLDERKRQLLARLYAYIYMENHYINFIKSLFVFAENDSEKSRYIYYIINEQFEKTIVTKDKNIYNDIDGHWYPITQIKIDNNPDNDPYVLYKLNAHRDYLQSIYVLYKIFEENYYKINNPLTHIDTSGATATETKAETEAKAEDEIEQLSEKNKNYFKELNQYDDIKELLKYGLTNDIIDEIRSNWLSHFITMFSDNPKLGEIIQRKDFITKLNDLRKNLFDSRKNEYMPIVKLTKEQKKIIIDTIKEWIPDKGTKRKELEVSKEEEQGSAKKPRKGGYINKDVYYHKYMKYKQKYINLRKQLSLI